MTADESMQLRDLGNAIYAALDLPFAQPGHDAERASLALQRMAVVRGAVVDLDAHYLAAAVKNLRAIPGDMPVTYPVADQAEGGEGR